MKKILYQPPRSRTARTTWSTLGAPLNNEPPSLPGTFVRRVETGSRRSTTPLVPTSVRKPATRAPPPPRSPTPEGGGGVVESEIFSPFRFRGVWRRSSNFRLVPTRK